MKLQPGNHSIVYQYVGYRKKEINIRIGDEPVVLNVVLEQEPTALEDVIISSEKEDPAYRIIRGAIENREFHLKEIKSFVCFR